MKRKYKFLTLLALIPLFTFIISGCATVGNSGGLGKGGIKGFLYSEDGGPLPLIELRVQASSDPMLNTPSLSAKVVYDKTKTRGYYELNDLPEGIYKVSFYIKEYQSGYTYYFTPTTVPDSSGSGSNNGDTGSGKSLLKADGDTGGDTGGDNGSDPGLDPGNQPAGGSDSGGGTHNVYEAYVKKGEMFLMPDIYLVKRQDIGTGGIRGKILSKYGDIPVKATVTVGDKNTVTDSEGNFIITDLSVKDYTIYIEADGYESKSENIGIIKDQVIQRDFYLEPQKAQIVGYVNISGRFASAFANDIEKYVKVTCSPQVIQGEGGGNSSPFQNGTNMFVFQVPANQPKYIINVRGLEPWFSNTVNYIVPTLSPGQVYTIPDEAIQFEYNHRTVILEATTPSTPPANSHIWCSVKLGDSFLDSFEMKPYGGNSYRATVDLPYGNSEFTLVGLTAISDKWQSESVTYSIDEVTNKVLMHIISNE